MRVMRDKIIETREKNILATKKLLLIPNISPLATKKIIRPIRAIRGLFSGVSKKYND